jgi:hypothetical protein
VAFTTKPNQNPPSVFEERNDFKSGLTIALLVLPVKTGLICAMAQKPNGSA